MTVVGTPNLEPVTASSRSDGPRVVPSGDGDGPFKSLRKKNAKVSPTKNKTHSPRNARREPLTFGNTLPLHLVRQCHEPMPLLILGGHGPNLLERFLLNSVRRLGAD